MNYGLGGETDTSGEKVLIKDIAKKLSGKPRSPVIFDVGANTGEYARALLDGFNYPIHLYCFEPSKKAFDKLSVLARENEQVHINNFGLGSEKKEEKLYYDQQGTPWASLYPRDLPHINKQFRDFETIQLDTLDEFCTREGIDAIDFLKIDVEGYELEVLKGAKNLLSENRIRFIQFEFGISNIDARTFLKEYFTILPHWDIYRLLQDGLQKINYDTRYEVFLTTNYLAVNNNF